MDMLHEVDRLTAENARLTERLRLRDEHIDALKVEVERLEAVKEERDCARQEACAFAAAIRNQVRIGSATWEDVAIESGWSYLIASPTPGEGGVI